MSDINIIDPIQTVFEDGLPSKNAGKLRITDEFRASFPNLVPKDAQFIKEIDSPSGKYLEFYDEMSERISDTSVYSLTLQSQIARTGSSIQKLLNQK